MWGPPMLFKREMVDAILEGRKTQTRRPLSDNPRSPWWREKCRLQPGKEFGIQGGRGMASCARAVVTGLERQALGEIDAFAAEAEGFPLPDDPFQGTAFALDAFWAYFARIHKGKVDEGMPVWVVEFRLLEEGK